MVTQPTAANGRRVHLRANKRSPFNSFYYAFCNNRLSMCDLSLPPPQKGSTSSRKKTSVRGHDTSRQAYSFV